MFTFHKNYGRRSALIALPTESDTRRRQKAAQGLSSWSDPVAAVAQTLSDAACSADSGEVTPARRRLVLSRRVSCRIRTADAPRGSPRGASGAPPSTALRVHLRRRSHPAAGRSPLHPQLDHGFPQRLPEVSSASGSEVFPRFHRTAEGGKAPCCPPGLVGVCGTHLALHRPWRIPQSRVAGA